MIRMTNIRIHAMEPLPTFNFLKELIPLTERRQRVVEKGRLDVTNILGGIDKRLLIIAGPCSIHDYRETVEIAQKISALARKYSDKMAILMRVCLDKPRTKKDWCGFLNDPKLDGSHDIPFGYKNGRKLMGEILDMGLPIACELLTPINFHIVSDMVSYAWIGARTVASPETRNMSSGLSVPVGIKNPNSTDNITDALANGDTWNVNAYGPITDAVAEVRGRKWTPNFLVVDPSALSGILKSDMFIDAAKYGSNEQIVNGEIGKVGGLKVLTTTNMPAGAALVIDSERASWMAVKRKLDMKRWDNPQTDSIELYFYVEYGIEVTDADALQLILNITKKSASL